MRKTFQYRLYPTRQQLKKLEATLEECRWLYNETLAYRKDAWEQRQHYVSWYDLTLATQTCVYFLLGTATTLCLLV